MKWDIVPGDAEQSILVYRRKINDPAIRTPELGRNVPCTKGMRVGVGLD